MHLVLSDLQRWDTVKMLGVAGRSLVGVTKDSMKCYSAGTE